MSLPAVYLLNIGSNTRHAGQARSPFFLNSRPCEPGSNRQSYLGSDCLKPVLALRLPDNYPASPIAL
jgi:hypothetical protein